MNLAKIVLAVSFVSENLFLLVSVFEVPTLHRLNNSVQCVSVISESSAAFVVVPGLC